MFSEEEVIELAKKVLLDEEYVIVDWQLGDEIWGTAGDVACWVAMNAELIPEELRELLENLLELLVKANLAPELTQFPKPPTKGGQP